MDCYSIKDIMAQAFINVDFPAQDQKDVIQNRIVSYPFELTNRIEIKEAT